MKQQSTGFCRMAAMIVSCEVNEKGGIILKPRITVLTLGVDDLERSLKFYRDGLGLPTKGIIGTEFEHGAVAFFDLESGLKLAIWNRKDLTHDANITQTGSSATEFTIGHNVSSKEEVDTVMEEIKKAGATITVPAHDTFWGGYSGYFQDPDGHLWEVVWNPEWEVTG
jgi:catechol 2,3-dioxygenase-like lactoylglutathione lyase family enzyme